MLDVAFEYDMTTASIRIEEEHLETYVRDARQDLVEWREATRIECEAVRVEWGEGTGRFDAEAECWLNSNAEHFLLTRMAKEEGFSR